MTALEIVFDMADPQDSDVTIRVSFYRGKVTAESDGRISLDGYELALKKVREALAVLNG